MLSSVALMAAQLSVSWEDNSANETGFKIERSADGVNFVQVGTVGADVVTYVDTTVVSSTTYWYRVAAYDGSSISDYSNTASMTTPALSVSPSITLQPASQSVNPGTSVSFSATAVGAPTPSLQWRKDGIDIANATSSTLVLGNVSSLDAGTYTVVASNSAGSATSNGAVLAMLTAAVTLPTAPVAIAPSITTQPTASQTVTAGADVILTVTASGSPAPTFQWKKNSMNIEGATAATLSLTAVSSVDAGTYTVTVTNSAGEVTSNQAALIIQTATPVVPVFTVAPAITSQPIASQTVTAGAGVTLSAKASGTPVPTYQWKKNGTNVAGATSANLVFKAVTSADAATYTVEATNSAGSATSNSSFLAVSTPVYTAPPAAPVSPAPVVTTPLAAAPTITLQPVAAQTVNVGDIVTLKVAASGSPAPNYQWKKDGIAISGATGATLALDSVTALDAGNYSVVATNSAGSVTSIDASLVVRMISLNPSPAPTPSTPVSTPIASTPGSDSAPEEVAAPVNASSPTRSRLVNLSVRAIPGPDDRALLVGFVVNGGTKSMLVRAVGPGLSTYTDATVFQDPKITLFSGKVSLASNDNWGGSEILKTNFARLGAFPLPEASKDAAILTSFAPKTYTANVTGSGTGLALAEIYDADESKEPVGRLV
ncbi:MAG TPA: immunoglobulin domain-containing protein, partial [Opitutus sp.]|nr:immunoglobulin domain-containing protein [Opitutus sp.]